MSSGERLKRPKLHRTRPIRSWSTLFDGGGAEANHASAPAREDHAVSLNDVVSRSVDLGYRVVDEYIRRGQEAARRINARSYDVQAMTTDLQDLGVRTLQYASDFAALWFDLVQRAATDSALLKPQAEADGTGATTRDDMGGPAPVHGHPAAAAVPARVKIEIASAQPTEVALDLSPGATGLPLIVHGLRAVDPEKPRLSDVGFRSGSDAQPPTVWVRVPPGQPPGVYSGVIVDGQSSRPVGTLSVRVVAAS